MDSDLETVRRALEDFLGKEVAAWFKKSQLVALQTKGFTTRAALELLTDAKMRSLQFNAAQRAAIKKGENLLNADHVGLVACSCVRHMCRDGRRIIAKLTIMIEQAPFAIPMQILTVSVLGTGGRPRFFNNISLIVQPDDPYDIPKIHTLRAVTQKSFERFAYNCGAVAVIISGEMYVPEDVQLEDGLICTAVKVDQPSIDLGVSLVHVKMPKAFPVRFTKPASLFLQS